MRIKASKTDPFRVGVTVGIEFDTEAMVLRLPQEKLERQRSLLATWRGRSSYLRRELESLAVLTNGIKDSLTAFCVPHELDKKLSSRP